MSDTVYSSELNETFNSSNNITTFPTQQVCSFSGLNSFEAVIELVTSLSCYRQSIPFSIFLILANLLILVFGLVGNCIVIYVVAWRIKTKTASSVFILNLAMADMLVMLCCIPATLAANLFVRKFQYQSMETISVAKQFNQNTLVFYHYYFQHGYLVTCSASLLLTARVCPYFVLFTRL